MALTPFGKALRKYRIDRDKLLKDMAEGVGVSPAFLSAVESGRKGIPDSLVGRIADWMNLDLVERNELQAAADLSAPAAQIPLSRSSSVFDRTLAMQLARNFDQLNEQQKEEIKQIMDRRKLG